LVLHPRVRGFRPTDGGAVEAFTAAALTDGKSMLLIDSARAARSPAAIISNHMLLQAGMTTYGNSRHEFGEPSFAEPGGQNIRKSFLIESDEFEHEQ